MKSRMTGHDGSGKTRYMSRTWQGESTVQQAGSSGPGMVAVACRDRRGWMMQGEGTGTPSCERGAGQVLARLPASPVVHAIKVAAAASLCVAALAALLLALLLLATASPGTAAFLLRRRTAILVARWKGEL